MATLLKRAIMAAYCRCCLPGFAASFLLRSLGLEGA
jgi:hypothetical protein